MNKWMDGKIEGITDKIKNVFVFICKTFFTYVVLLVMLIERRMGK